MDVETQSASETSTSESTDEESSNEHTDAPATELLTVIVPCYNEEDSVGATVSSVLDTAPDLPVDVELLLIDDGSTDQTRERIRGLEEAHPECRSMFNAQNRGLGWSVTRAYERIDPDSWATVIPGDNEFVFDSIKNFLAVRDDYDLILGYLKNPVIRPVIRRLASDAFTKVVNTLYGFSYRYLNGMKMYRVSCFQGLEVVSGGHAFNPELFAKALLRDPTIRIGEVPYAARGRSEGESKAFSADEILRAMHEVYKGHRAVARFRQQMVQNR